MNKSEQKILLDKLDRDSLTLGASVPDEMDVQEQTVPLNTIVFKVCSDGKIPDRFNIDLKDFRRVLRKEMNECVDKIENRDVSYQEGRELVKKISQVQRSLNVLESPDQNSDIESTSKISTAKDTKRWRKFVSKVKGK